MYRIKRHLEKKLNLNNNELVIFDNCFNYIYSHFQNIAEYIAEDAVETVTQCIENAIIEILCFLYSR